MRIYKNKGWLSTLILNPNIVTKDNTAKKDYQPDQIK